MEYLRNNLGALSVVGIGLISKKLVKKEIVPVSGWKQILTTYITVAAGVMLGEAIEKEINKNRTVPKPN